MQTEKIIGGTYCVETEEAVIGLYVYEDKSAVLIDSGVKPDEALVSHVVNMGLRLEAVLCTHLHPDHVANNLYFYERCGAEILLPDEPFLFVPEKPYPYSFIKAGDRLPGGVEAIAVPGHSPGQLAFLTPDGVCFTGDALISQPLLKASKLPYIEDVEEAIRSMEKLRALKCPFYAVAHKAVVGADDIDALIDENIQKELELYARLRRIVSHAMDIEEALDIFMDELGITPRIQRSVHTREPVRARLRTLAAAGELIIEGERVRPKEH